MDHADADLRGLIADLARRLDAVESLLQVRRATDPEPAAPAPTPTPASDPGPIPAGPAMPTAASTAAAPPARVTTFVAARSAAAPTSRVSTTPGDTTGALRIERLVGGRLFAVVGALIVVAGAGLFLKLAWDLGWFGLIPDVVKCAMSALFGAALLVCGEVARRRLGAAASIGCSAAGMGVLYATSYAAYGVFDLVPAGAGFGLLVVTTLLGIGVGARAALPSISALSLIAGYLTPLLFLDVDAPVFVLPVYLLSLLVLGLTVCGLRGKAYWMLRSIAWFGTIGLGTAWLVGALEAHPSLAIAFLGCAWAAIHGELLWSAHRNQLAPPEAGQPLDEWSTIRPLASSFTSTAWAIVGSAITVDLAWGHNWIVTAIGTLVLFALSTLAAPPIRLLCDRPATDLQRLGAVFLAQSGALLVMTIALAWAPWLEIVGWLAVGVAAVLAARRIDSRALDGYGLVVLGIATTRLLVLEWWIFDVSGSRSLLGLHLTRYSALVVAAAIAWLIAGSVLRRSARASDPWRPASHGIIGLGLALLFTGVLHEAADPFSAAVVVLGLAATLHQTSRLLRSTGLGWFSVAVHVVMLLVVFSQHWWLRSHLPLIELPGLVITRWTILLWGAALSWFILTRRATGTIGELAVAIPGTGAAIATAIVMGSLLHLDARALPISVTWVGLAIAWLARSRAVRSCDPDRLDARRIAHAVALLAILPWLIGARPLEWIAFTGWAPLAHGRMGVACVVAGALGAVAWVSRRDRIAPGAAIVSTCAAGGMVFLASSLEVARLAFMFATEQSSQRAAVSIWWGVFAAALLTIGFRWSHPIVRRVGLGLMATAAAKAILYDLVGVPAGWRVASFLSLGLLMLGVGLVYARLSNSAIPDRHAAGV